MLNESGVAGADRVKSRLDFQQFLSSYQHLLSQFPGFVSMKPSGSYNSNPDKQDFGDIDLIVHIQSEKDKATIKKELQAFFTRQPETVIVPFSSAKHAGKRTYNAGELVSVRFHDNALGYSAQIDNIVALDHLEAAFKKSFLDMPAEVQGLVLGLVKIATIESAPAVLFQKLGIKAPTQLEPDQEYEFNLSGVELQLRKVTYEPGTFKQIERNVIWNSKNYDDLQKLLYQYDLNTSFDNLLQQAKEVIRNPRSNQRMQGVFSSMISVKSGEVGTPKGAGKEAALARVQQAFGESRRSLFRSLIESNNRTVAFAFGRFQPPTIGHELLINKVKQTAERAGTAHVIYVSKKQDHKTNPLDIITKMKYLQKMFPGTNFVAADDTVRTPIEAITHLNQKYNGLIWVAGSDRLPTFTKLANEYNGKDYQYQNIQVISSGSRDPDSDDAAGMSGTKMRDAAVADDLQTFMQGLPGTISEQDAMNLMNLIKQGMQKPAKAVPIPKLPKTNEATFKKSPYGRTAASQQRAKDLLNPPKPPEPNKDEKGVAEGSLSEKINPKTLTRGFVQEKDMGLYTLQAVGDWASRMADEPPTMEIYAMLKPEAGQRYGKQIGQLSLKIAQGRFLKDNPGAEALVAGAVDVDPAYQRKGVASAMYAFAKELGNDVIASVDQSDDAVAMWKGMRAKGVAEEGYGNHPSQRVDPRTGKKYVPPKSPLGQGVAEGWKDIAIGGAMALGALGAGHAQAADLSSFNTQYLQQVVSGEHPRPMVSIDDAKQELQARVNGKQQAVFPAVQADTSKGYSKEYLQKAADPNRFGRYLISVEKAQELLNKMQEGPTRGKGVPISEDVQNIMDSLINKIIFNEAVSNNRK